MAINSAFLAELKQESDSTRKMLERVPPDKYTWKPHPKSMTLGRLAQHVAELTTWVSQTMIADQLDFETDYHRPPEFTTHKELMDYFEKNLAEAIQALNDAKDEDFSKPWTLRRGEHVYFTMPRKVVLRTMVMNHLIHHRGQLSVDLRLLDVPLPRMYGPTADEPILIANAKN